jgi:hypothetical protein
MVVEMANNVVVGNFQANSEFLRFYTASVACSLGPSALSWMRLDVFALIPLAGGIELEKLLNDVVHNNERHQYRWIKIARAMGMHIPSVWQAASNHF